MGFSRQNYWSMLPFTGDLPNQGCNLESVFQGDSLLSEPQGKTLVWKKWDKKGFCKLKLIIYDSYWVTCSVQFSSATQSCPTLCNPVNCRTPGLPVHHQLPESTQTNVHWVVDAIQPTHPLLSPSLPALNLSQDQGLFKWVSFSHQVAKILEFQLQHQSLQWTPRTNLFKMDCLDLPVVEGTLKSLLQHHSSKASILQHSAFFIVQLSHPYMTTGKTIALTRWTSVDK